MQNILKKFFIVTGVFFLVNVFLLLSLRHFHSSTNKHGPNPPLDRPINPKFQVLITSAISPSTLFQLPKTDVVLPVVVFGCNRPHALQIHVEALLGIRKNPELHPIIVSLDCHDDATIQVAKNFGDKIQAIIE
ncbi:unnamed protein product, partial [Rotaria sp. Silwood2]